MSALASYIAGIPRSIRFLLAGGVAAGVNWGVRFPLSAIMPFAAAVIVAAIIGMAVGFLAYRRFVYERSSRPMSEQIRYFVLVNAASMVVVTVAAMVLRALLLPVMDAPLAEAAAHALAIAIGAVLNYFAHGAITFQIKPHSVE